MGLLDRFRRNKSDDVLPSEVDEYYKSELRSRRGASILMALVALAITLIIAAGLFFGGRAVYRAIKNDDNKPTIGQTGSEHKSEQNASSNQSSQSGSSSSNSSPTSNPAPSGSSNTPQPSMPAPSTSAPIQSMPSTGDSLPATGDEGL